MPAPATTTDRRSAAVSAARIRIALIAVLAGVASTADAAPQAPTVTLLAPGNGTLAQGPPTFRWRIDAAATVYGGVAVTHQVAADQSFTDEVTTTTRQCPAANVNCWSSLLARRAYSGRRYWRVAVSGAVTATSPTWLFVGTTTQTGLDRVRPRVRAYPGAASRGRKAVFVARVSDNRGEARMRVDLAYRNQLVFRTMTLLKPVRWAVKQRFDSRVRLPRSLHPGRYRLCVTAWDRTGNQARSCARYTVR
jgi:hypothetical protein